jgi:hypothetical protein
MVYDILGNICLTNPRLKFIHKVGVWDIIPHMGLFSILIITTFHREKIKNFNNKQNLMV